LELAPRICLGGAVGSHVKGVIDTRPLRTMHDHGARIDADSQILDSSQRSRDDLDPCSALARNLCFLRQNERRKSGHNAQQADEL
jgi:hypothetical protein